MGIGIGLVNSDLYIVENYEKGNNYTGKFFLVSGDHRIKYKTEEIRDNYKCISYHFKQRFNKDLYYQFFVSYGTKFIGTETENQALKALDLLASTYTEYIEEYIPKKKI